MKKKIKKTGEFAARGSDGKNYKVFEYTEFNDVTTVSDTVTQWFPVSKIMKLDNGDHVNSVDEGKFVIVRTGVLLSV